MGKPIEEWGPKCARCGHEEYRIDGYCSVYCRDMAEVEEDLDVWVKRAVNVEKEYGELAQRTKDIKKKCDKLRQVLDDISWMAFSVDHDGEPPEAEETLTAIREFITRQSLFV